MKFSILPLSILLSSLVSVLGQGTDYVTEVPATVYEAAEQSPQNADYDAANKMFVAHAGWLSDKLVHYYKFRIFAPSIYEGLITGESTAADIPLQKIFFMTTDGTMDGVMGKPVIDFHHVDGNSYSDFMEVSLVTVDAAYAADSYKSVGDIEASGSAVAETGIILNIPVVPTNSVLQDPAGGEGGASAAPITPTPVFYKGVEVWTYVFEVTDQVAADYFASTRDGTAGYEVPVTSFASAGSVNAIPLWHINQFSNGVSAGVNNGGPNPDGMRNYINLDRPDTGYSPLWQLQWLTEVPTNYMADDVTNNADLTAQNGFVFVTTPMFVNCPDVGVVADATPSNVENFQTNVVPDMDMNMIQGSHSSFILEGDVPVSLQTSDGTMLMETETTGMGSYSFALDGSAIPAGETSLKVMAKGEVIRELSVGDASGASKAKAFGQFLLYSGFVAAAFLL